MVPSLHDILNGLAASRACANFIAEEIELADPQAAAVLRKFSEELCDVWNRYYPVLPTNKDINLLLNRPEITQKLQIAKNNEGN